MKELELLKEKLNVAISRIGAQYHYLTEVIRLLEKTESEPASEAIKDVKEALIDLRNVGRDETKVFRAEEKIVSVLKELKKILPKIEQEKAQELIDHLEPIERKILKAVSIFTGQIKKELEDIQVDERMLEHFTDPNKKEKITRRLKDEIKTAEQNVQKIITWLQGEGAVLKHIQGFEESLEKMAA